VIKITIIDIEPMKPLSAENDEKKGIKVTRTVDLRSDKMILLSIENKLDKVLELLDGD
jgi:hypothetical protein